MPREKKNTGYARGVYGTNQTSNDKAIAEDFLNTFQTDDFFCFDRLLKTDTAKNFWDEFRKSKEYEDLEVDEKFVPQSQKLYDDIVTMLVGRGVTYDSETNLKMVIEYMLPSITNINSKHFKFVKALINHMDLVRLVQQPIYKRYKVNEDLHINAKATDDVYAIFIYLIAGLAAQSKRCVIEENNDADNNTDYDEQDNNNADDSVDETDDDNDDEDTDDNDETDEDDEDEYTDDNKKTKKSKKTKGKLPIEDIPTIYLQRVAKYTLREALELIDEDFLHKFKRSQKMKDKNKDKKLKIKLPTMLMARLGGWISSYYIDKIWEDPTSNK